MPFSSKLSSKSEALLAPMLFVSKNDHEQKVVQLKKSLKEEILDKTKLFAKSRRLTPTVADSVNQLKMNSRCTLKEREVLSPGTSKHSSYGFKVHQHYSPVSNSRKAIDSKLSPTSYFQAMKSFAQGTPKSIADCVRGRNMSTKNLSQKTLNCFMSVKNPNVVVSKLKEGAQADCPQNQLSKQIVLADKTGWANKGLEGAIKFKVPEKLKDMYQSSSPQHKQPRHSAVMESVAVETQLELRNENSKKVTKTPNSKVSSHKDETHLKSSKSALSNKNCRVIASQTKESTEAENSSNCIDSAKIESIDFDLITSIATQLFVLNSSLRQSKDPSATLKLYTELVQDRRYSVFESLFNNATSLGSEIRQSIKMEILCVMHVFYALIENDTKSRSLLFEAFDLCCNSCYLTMKVVSEALESVRDSRRLKVVKEFLDSTKSTVPESSLRAIKKNNAKVLSALHSVVDEAVFVKIAPQIKQLMNKLSRLSFESSIEAIFECFFNALKDKGAMSVLYNEEALLNDEPNFVLQPFNNLTYLPKKSKSVPLTLVLDLDETLVHYAQITSETGEFYIRPYSQEFLIELSPFFEIVIFTAAVKCYADWIIDRLDTQRCISHRLYRCSTKQQKGVFIKDLSRIGRELSKTIIVDNNPDNFQYQAENGIFIKSWYDDPNDTALEELSKLLKVVARRSNEDVRTVLGSIREKMQSMSLDQLLKET